MGGGNMNYGFQCFDPDTGLQIFEATDRLTKVIGIINPNSTPNFSGTVVLTDDQLRGGNIFAIPMRYIAYDIDNERFLSTSRFNSGVSIASNGVNCNKIDYPVLYGVW